MAKIRLRLDSCEVEIESRDFYVDNDSAASVIDSIARSMQGMAAPRAQVLAATEAAVAASAGTADAGDAGASGSGRAARGADGSRPQPPAAAAASTAAAAPSTDPPIRCVADAVPAPALAGRPLLPEADLSSALDCLDEAEVFEPEFDEPRRVAPSEVAARLRALAGSGFFGERRTVSETVDAMAERGWLAGPLDVSKALARMAMGREMRRETSGYRTYYCAAPPAAEPASLAAAALAPFTP